MRHIREIIVLAVVLVGVVLAVRAVGARARPVESAVPVLWVLCEDVSEPAHGAGADETIRDACRSLSCLAVASCEDDDGDDDYGGDD